MLDKDLRGKIISENIEVHRIEAPVYRTIHPELYNWYEQFRIVKGLRQALALSPGIRALDVGCGTGNITLRLLKAGCTVTALDISPDMIEALRLQMHRRGFDDSIQLVCLEIDWFLEQSEETYDLVTFSSVLHHLPDYLTTLSNVASKVNPGGVIYIVHEPFGIYDPERSNLRDKYDAYDLKLYWYSQRLAHKILRGPSLDSLEPRDWTYSDYHVYHGFDDVAVLELLRREGFIVVFHRRYRSAYHTAFFNWLDNLTTREKHLFMALLQKE